MISLSGRGRPAFLASVTSADEAETALHAGADVIDAKDPSSGALGALDAEVVREIVERIAGRAPVSATVGDLPADPAKLVAAARSMASTGVDLVKVGFFGDADPRLAIAALGEADLGRARLVAVLMADRGPDFALLPHLARHGFTGAMLDTADKANGRLTTVLAADRVAAFVTAAHAANLFAGLAGSLRKTDIAGLARLRPDVLGFRGALCAEGRATALDPTRVAAVRAALDTDPLREKSVA